MNHSFRSKVCVITGAGSGIGRALAENLAAKGAKLALSDIDTEGLAETVRRCEALGAQVESDQLDVSEREAVLLYAAAVKQHFGTVNQVYNIAGIGYHGDVETESFKDIERIMDVDYWGIVNSTKAFLPMLLESGDGHVINMSSLAGLVSLPLQSAYNSAKFAVRGFTESLNQEMRMGRKPVKVTCVHPGGIKTAVARNAVYAENLDGAKIASLFDEKMAIHTPEMAARTIVRGVSKGKSRVVVGWEAKLTDVMQRLLPSGYQAFNAFVNRRVQPRSGELPAGVPV